MRCLGAGISGRKVALICIKILRLIRRLVGEIVFFLGVDQIAALLALRAEAGRDGELEVYREEGTGKCHGRCCFCWVSDATIGRIVNISEFDVLTYERSPARPVPGQVDPGHAVHDSDGQV